MNKIVFLERAHTNKGGVNREMPEKRPPAPPAPKPKEDKMEITIYELLGLVKDGKAPKKIKIGNKELYFSKTKNTYEFEDGGSLNWCYYVTDDSLYRKVNVIEEDAFEDIEEINLGVLNTQSDKNKEFKNAINALIKNQKKIISKLDKESDE